jgi:hypothetical protein
MGVVGYALSNRFIFFAVALLVIPALVAVSRIRAADIHFGRSVGAPDYHNDTPPLRAGRAAVWENPSLLMFAVSLFLFLMANASILPLVGEILAHRDSRQSSAILALLMSWL